MALMPSKTKFRKQQRGNRGGLSKAGVFVHFGDLAYKLCNEDG